MLTKNYFRKILHSLKLSVRPKSSHRRGSVKKGALKYFVNFTGKHLCWGSLFNNVATRNAPKQIFPVKFAKCLITLILKSICEWLLLKIVQEQDSTKINKYLKNSSCNWFTGTFKYKFNDNRQCKFIYFRKYSLPI